MVAKFRKKPVIVAAVQFDGSNFEEMFSFTRGRISDDRHLRHASGAGDHLFIKTLEGEMRISDGDWLIRGVAGEFYPCKPNIFEMTYEPVEED